MKYLLADDHALFREGMKHVLASFDDSLEIIEANTSRQAIDFAKELTDITLVLMDLRMPDIDGITATKEILLYSPATLVVILTASEKLSDMRLAFQAGAMGYIEKSASPEIMQSAIGLVLSGGLYVPPVLVQETNNRSSKSDISINLTPRQEEVLKLIIDGHSNKQLAHMLDLSEATIKVHVSAIFKALNVNNRTQAAMVAQKLGI